MSFYQNVTNALRTNWNYGIHSPQKQKREILTTGSASYCHIEKNAVTKVKQLLHYLNFNPVVYEDTSHVVENSVPGIESSYHYSSFILDKDGMIKVLGDPTANYSIEKLMLRHLKQKIR